MSQNFLGEIRMFAANFAPLHWAFCNGQLLPINQNQTLFSLIGTTYGGNGTSTFALPNLEGRVPMHQGQGPGLSLRPIGEASGTEQVTLVTTTMPSHSHTMTASSTKATTAALGDTVLTADTTDQGAPLYATVTDEPTMGVFPETCVHYNGGGQPHDNMMPTLCVTFIIALQGIFPSRN